MNPVSLLHLRLPWSYALPLLALSLAGAPTHAATHAPPSRLGAEEAGLPGGSVPQEETEPQVWVERNAYLMGTLLRLRVAAASRADAVRATEEAIRSVEGLEAVLSSWRKEAELSRANRAPVGRPFPLSDELGRLLVRASRWAAEMDGAFDPAVGALIDAWDLRGEGRRPSPEALERARMATGARGVELAPDGTTLTRRSEEAWIDAGAFGKGAALERAESALRARGVERALLDFGGQILAFGWGPGEAPDEGWTVAVADPREREPTGIELRIRGRSVATTSAWERTVDLDGEAAGHVLDPRTGRPVAPWGSVTVVAADPLAADALATGLFVLGPAAALEWSEGRCDLGVLVLEGGAGPRARWNRGMERWLRRPLPPSPGPDAVEYDSSTYSGSDLRCDSEGRSTE